MVINSWVTIMVPLRNLTILFQDITINTHYVTKSKTIVDNDKDFIYQNLGA